MKLLTHNMLSCHIKGVKNGYPFKIDPVKVNATSRYFLQAFISATSMLGGQASAAFNPLGWTCAAPHLYDPQNCCISQ